MTPKDPPDNRFERRNVGRRAEDVELAELRGDIQNLKTWISGQIELIGERLTNVAEDQAKHEETCANNWISVNGSLAKLKATGWWFTTALILGMGGVICELAYLILDK